MKLTLIATLLSLASLAACGDRPPQPRVDSQPAASGGGSAASAGASSSTPANVGQPPTTDERKEGANPTQQQVDPKQREQRRDFEMSGSERGPTSTETQPTN